MCSRHASADLFRCATRTFPIAVSSSHRGDYRGIESFDARSEGAAAQPRRRGFDPRRRALAQPVLLAPREPRARRLLRSPPQGGVRGVRNLEAVAKPIDVVTLENEIAKGGKLDAIGGIAFLGELALRVPTADNVFAYSRDRPRPFTGAQADARRRPRSPRRASRTGSRSATTSTTPRPRSSRSRSARTRAGPSR